MKHLSVSFSITTLRVLLFIPLMLFLASCTNSSVSATVTSTFTTIETATTPASSLPVDTEITPTLVSTTSSLVSPNPVQLDVGSVKGRVLFMDNTPANSTTVGIFKSGDSLSTDVESTDQDGYYYFLGLPIGNYEIQPSFHWDSEGVETPTIDVTVGDNQLTQAATIVVPRDINAIYCNGSEIIMFQFTAPMSPLKLSWTNIPNAVNYTVTITGNPHDTPPGPINYDDSVNTTMATMTWPTLQIGGYQIIIKALDQQNEIIGIGMSYFEVN